MIDMQKRRRIMQRSAKLGHCICNPKQGCPCDTFRERDVCPCAGERLEHAVEEVALTKLVEKAGCASKINQNDLKQVLAGLSEISDPNVLVGTNTCDDAGVYRIDDNTALVQTVDVFTPSVDDAYTFGQIAAANSLSDVYAMGGRPLTALSIIGFPIETISPRVMTQMLRGGLDKMREAGVVVVGGHSVNDKEPKFGYAVTGVVHPSKIVTNDKACVGDVLVLTKPLGVGAISFAGQMGMASDEALAAAAGSMAELNRNAAEVMLEFGVQSATDVTGFGLFGHLGEMVSQSGVTAEVYFDQVPVFGEALELIARGVVSGGIERNREHASALVSLGDGVTEDMAHVLYDPQTSGGLLIAVLPERADALIARLRERGVACAAAIGRVVAKSDGRIVVRRDAGAECLGAAESKQECRAMDEVEVGGCCGGNGHGECCAGGPELGGATTSETEKRFKTFMGSVFGDGAISGQTKELIAIALSLLSKCEPCVKIHIDEARELGVSEEEISEAIWLAISFGGAPTMMFYRSIMEKA